jgi:hypothetical protein
MTVLMIIGVSVIGGLGLSWFIDIFFNPPPTDYRPTLSKWKRWLAWNIRNPWSGLINMVAASDIKGGSTWNPNGGWWHYNFKNGLPRFVSYRGSHIEWYIGWRPSGLFGIAVRHARAKNYK